MRELVDNPFFVLGVGPDDDRLAVERQAQKLLGMLELGFADAARYRSPLGEHRRDADAVRAAVAALRDPRRRLVAELWARHAPATVTVADSPRGGRVDDGAPPWTGARAATGWGLPARGDDDAVTPGPARPAEAP
ncbi:MAG: hypothetical protein KA297_31805 [Kofleriaceae bacterium]|jgi:hypothetical protein|nr:hypothetical protein [Kofleriaceae bacterium]MBP6839685.1 hypothetical protein [Kofleriaceae bacterium]